VRAWYSSQPAAERKRRSLNLTGPPGPVDSPRRPVPLTPAEKADRVAALKNVLIGTAPACDARARERGGSHP
jgi:hypothetical protein